jgi:hypothetical protein
MAKVIVSEYVSLDGVMEAPSGEPSYILQEIFWASRGAMLPDRFGTPCASAS